MATFALVHGAWHGGWCFDLLGAELEARGQRPVAVDLPCDDPEAGATAYAEVALRALADAGDDVVLVGHSLGGLTIPLVAAARPARRLVYLCSLLAVPGQSLIDQLRAEPDIFVPDWDAAVGRDDLRRSYWTDAEAAIAGMYADCPRALAEDAYRRLRPQGRAASTEPCPLDALPAVPASYVLARDDAAISPAWSRRAAAERLGLEPLELPGSHSPMLARPAALADVLIGFV
jgi:pimeloyl-ACP methyl ester carboxylesterase